VGYCEIGGCRILSMLLRFFAGTILSTGLLCACDCIEVSAKQARRSSELVFRGTVDGFRDSGKGYRIAIFRVTNVWKGQIGQTFEIPAIEGDWCHAFRPTKPSLLETGNELIVYASRIAPGKDYFPMPCNTALAKTTMIVHDLGPGRRPK
jgi:hypothetical protein